jgi:hypothetical protein
MIATCYPDNGRNTFLVFAVPQPYHSHNCSENKLMFPSRDAKAAVLAPCDAANCTAMGIEADIFPARGTFYVVTQANSPYCGKYAYQNRKAMGWWGKSYLCTSIITGNN